MCGACAQQSHHCHVSYEEEDTCVGHVHSRVIIAMCHMRRRIHVWGMCTAESSLPCVI